MMPSYRKARTRGFTLIEVMIVLGLIAILAGALAINAQSAAEEARATACEKNRVLYEATEAQFAHDKGRPTFALEELVTAKYLNKATCPRGGVLAWDVTDPSLPGSRQALVCSIHGAKQRINAWKPLQQVASGDGDGDGDGASDGGPGAALSSDFDDGVAAGWNTSRGGFWEVSDGKLFAGRPDGKRGGRHEAFNGDPNWTDYKVAVDVELEAGNGFRVFFRSSGETRPDGYALQYKSNGKNKGTYSVRHVNSGNLGRTLATQRVSGSDGLLGRSANVAVAVSGSSFSVQVDGKQILAGSDSKYRSGGIGLGTLNRGLASFDNVRVTATQ